MPRSRARMQEINRRAAASLWLCSGLIVGLSFLVLHFSVWRAQEPVPNEPFYSTLPGVDMADLSPVRAETLLRRLNAQRCPCECMRTVASCRNHHGSCALSLATSREAVEAARKR